MVPRHARLGRQLDAPNMANDVSWRETSFGSLALTSLRTPVTRESVRVPSVSSQSTGHSPADKTPVIRGAHLYPSSLQRRFSACWFGFVYRADAVSRTLIIALDAAWDRLHSCTSTSARCEI